MPLSHPEYKEGLALSPLDSEALSRIKEPDYEEGHECGYRVVGGNSNLRGNSDKESPHRGGFENIKPLKTTRFLLDETGKYCRMVELGVTYLSEAEIDDMYKAGVIPIWTDKILPAKISREMVKCKQVFLEGTSRSSIQSIMSRIYHKKRQK